MKTSNFLLLAAICFLLLGIPGEAQQPAKNTSGSVLIDSFLDEEEVEKDYPFVVSVKWHLMEETLPELFTEIALYKMPCLFQGCDISLIDIAEAIQISRFTTEDIAEAIGKLNITGTDAYNIVLIYEITPDLIENFLQKFTLTFSDIYKNFVESLANPGESIPSILNILNVSVFEFMNAQTYGNDTVKLKVLSTGDYSQKNLNAILTLTNKTALDLLKLMPLNSIAKQLRKLDPVEFTNFVMNLGVTSRNLGDFYKYLNVTPINFLAYSRFIQIVTGYYDLLNPEEVLGTIVSNAKVATTNKAKVLSTYQNKSITLLRNFANFHVELVENPLVQYNIKNVTLINPAFESRDLAYIEVKNPVITTFSEVTKVYNTTELRNCTYISKLPIGGLYSEKIPHAHLVNGTVTITKGNETMYNLGSPLFCQEKLYGIAVEENARTIKFATFLKKTFTVTTTPTTGTTGQKPEVSGNVTKPNLVTQSNVTTVSGPSSSASSNFSMFSCLVLVFIKLLL